MPIQTVKGQKAGQPSLRSGLFIKQDLTGNLLGKQRMIARDMGELNHLWDEMKSNFPEYVELRRMDIVSFSKLKQMLWLAS